MKGTAQQPRTLSGICLLLTAFALLAVPTPSSAQNETTPPESLSVDQAVFDQIRLDIDGVTAEDTTGQAWQYDFNSETWVPEGFIGEGRGIISDRPDIEDVPIEERCTELRKLKPAEKTILIGYDEYVDGDILAFGRVTIKGWVKGNVVSVRSRVLVTETGQVDGDIRAPEILVLDGGVVLGEVEERTIIDPSDFASGFDFDGLAVALAFTAVFLFFSFLIAAAMPRHLARVQQCIRSHRVKTFALGLLAIFMMPVLIGVVTITVVGVLVIPLVPLAYLGAVLLAVAGFGGIFGRSIGRRWLGIGRNAILHTFVGTTALMSMWILVALLLGSTSEVANGFGIFALVVSILVSSVAVCNGLGAVLLTRFGFREHTGRGSGDETADPAPAPAPPPIPESPPMSPPIESPDRKPPGPGHPNNL